MKERKLAQTVLRDRACVGTIKNEDQKLTNSSPLQGDARTDVLWQTFLAERNVSGLVFNSLARKQTQP